MLSVKTFFLKCSSQVPNVQGDETTDQTKPSQFTIVYKTERNKTAYLYTGEAGTSSDQFYLIKINHPIVLALDSAIIVKRILIVFYVGP